MRRRLTAAEQTAVEARVLGSLLEKQRISPESYPLSANNLRRASNQARNRDPRASYEEPEIRDAVRRLIARGWVELSLDPGIRVRRYRHLLDEALGMDSAELALMAVLLLRGPQTAGKLRQRTDRLYGFENVAAVYEALDRLVERGYVARVQHRVGQTEERYEQLLCVASGDEEPGGEGEEPETRDGEAEEPPPDDEDEGASEPAGEVERAVPEAPVERAAPAPAGPDDALPASPEAWVTPRRADTPDARLDWLENEVVKLRAQVSALIEAGGENPRTGSKGS